LDVPANVSIVSSDCFQAGAMRPPEIKLYRLSEAADAHLVIALDKMGAHANSDCALTRSFRTRTKGGHRKEKFQSGAH